MVDATVISIDAMGGDNAPVSVIEGVKRASEEHPETFFLLFGDELKIAPLAKEKGLSESVYKIYHTTETVRADDKPSAAVRYGRNTSMFKAIYSVRTGEAKAVVSAGNTGAFMAMSKICLGTIAGVDRPALAAVLPTSSGQPVVMLDLGANAECNAMNLVEFAIMGSVFYRLLYKVAKPSISLLNIGSEETKGREEIREAATILKDNNLNYKGFVEGFDINSGSTHVIVSDGFSGNVALKTIEGTARLIKNTFKDVVKKSILAKLGFVFFMPALLKLKKKMDPRQYNGAMFLGLNGISVKSHGSADALSYAHAISVAYDLSENKLCEKIKAELEDLIFTPEPISSIDEIKPLC